MRCRLVNSTHKPDLAAKFKAAWIGWVLWARDRDLGGVDLVRTNIGAITGDRLKGVRSAISSGGDKTSWGNGDGIGLVDVSVRACLVGLAVRVNDISLVFGGTGAGLLADGAGQPWGKEDRAVVN